MAENKDGQEKTEAASSKRKEEATEKGDVAKSSELNTVAVLSGALIILNTMAGSFIDTIQGYMGYVYSESSLQGLNNATIAGVMQLLLITFAKVLGPLLATVMFFAIVSNVGQVGFIIATKALIPDFKKLSPVSGIKRMFSPRSLVELVKGVLKIAIIGSIGYIVITDHLEELLLLSHLGIDGILGTAGAAIYDLTYKVLIALFVMAVADFAYQKYEHEKKLKMTKNEKKDETKQTDGDPKVKGQIKSKQREMAMNRMMGDVPDATVVVTNPTHYAVALKYNPLEKADAPKIVAKGKNLIAQKIKEIDRKSVV